MTRRTKPIRVHRLSDVCYVSNYSGNGRGGYGTANGGVRTLEQVARILNCTKQNVAQQERKALRKMRVAMIALGLSL